MRFFDSSLCNYQPANTNRPISQSTNQSINQPFSKNQPIQELISHPNKSARRSINPLYPLPSHVRMSRWLSLRAIDPPARSRPTRYRWRPPPSRISAPKTPDGALSWPRAATPPFPPRKWVLPSYRCVVLHWFTMRYSTLLTILYGTRCDAELKIATYIVRYRTRYGTATAT